MIARRMKSLNLQFFASLNDRIIAMQSKGEEILRLDIGSPDLPPAEHIIETLYNAACQADRHGYQPHAGNLALRRAWTDMYAREYSVTVDADREILPLLGSKEGIFHLHQALIDPGDVVLIPDPGYLTYTQATRFAGGEPYYLPLLPEQNYIPNLSNIPADVLSKAKLLWLNYPNNPTGATVTIDFFKQAVQFGIQHRILVCHDAAYSQVVFDDYQAPSLLAVPGAKETAVEFNTLSKSHNMAGWRVGAILGNETVISTSYRLKTNVDSGHFLPIMEAAVAAMTRDQSWIAQRNKIYQQRRDMLVSGLYELGLKPKIPKASLYIWCPVPAGWRSIEFCEALLEKARVSVTPGVVFGAQGEGYMRIAITTSQLQIEHALENMKNVWKDFERNAL